MEDANNVEEEGSLLSYPSTDKLYPREDAEKSIKREFYPKLLFLSALTITLSSFCSGFGIVILFFGIRIVSIDDVSDSILLLLPFVFTCCFGAFLAGIIGKHGCRICLIGAASCTAFSSLISLLFFIIIVQTNKGVSIALSYEKYVAAVAQGIVGMGIGLSSVISPLFLKELSPRGIKGLVIGFHPVMISLGIFMGYFLSLFFYEINSKGKELNQYWRLIFILPFVFSLTQILSFLSYIKFDSPYFYYLNGKFEKMEEVLGKIYRFEERREMVKQEYNDELTRLNDQSLSMVGNWKELLHPYYKPSTRLSAILCTGKQLSGFTLLMTYSGMLFNDDAQNYSAAQKQIPISPAYGMLFVAISNLCFTLLAVSLTDRFGRKIFLLFGTFIIFVILMILGIAWLVDPLSQPLSITLVLLFVGGYGLSLGPLVWIYIAEILNLKGLSLAVVISFVMEIPVILITAFSLKHLYISVPKVNSNDFILPGTIAIVCSLLMAAFVVFIIFRVPETGLGNENGLEKSIINEGEKSNRKEINKIESKGEKNEKGDYRAPSDFISDATDFNSEYEESKQNLF